MMHISSARTLLIVASLLLLSSQTSHAARVDKVATPLSRTAIDAGEAWYAANGGMGVVADDDGHVDVYQSCCEVMGDINNDGVLNPMDASGYVLWVWLGGDPPPCLEEANVNCSVDGVNPLDAVYLVNYFWGGGPAPCDCSELP